MSDLTASRIKLKAKAQEIRGTTVKTTLSRLFRRMLVSVAGTIDVSDSTINNVKVDDKDFMDRLVSFGRYEQLMLSFVNDSRNCIPTNRKDQSSARGNLQKEILKADMSWKVFTKALRFLKFKSFEISITAHHSNGTISTYKEHVNLGNPAIIEQIPDGAIDYSSLFSRENKFDLKHDEKLFREAADLMDRSDKNI